MDMTVIKPPYKVEFFALLALKVKGNPRRFFPRVIEVSRNPRLLMKLQDLYEDKFLGYDFIIQPVVNPFEERIMDYQPMPVTLTEE